MLSCNCVDLFHTNRKKMEESFMKRLLVSSAAVMLATSFVVAAELESGLQVGDFVGAFNVKDITGPSKGKSLCYR